MMYCVVLINNSQAGYFDYVRLGKLYPVDNKGVYIDDAGDKRCFLFGEDGMVIYD